jgi:uncharacterized membrane protein YhhN
VPYHLLPIPASLLLIGAYLVARNRNDLKKTAVIQPLTTLASLIIAALGLLSPRGNPSYTAWILVGMGLCLLADIFNIDMTNDKILYAAIGAFALAYLEYAFTFTRFSGFQPEDVVVGIVFLLIYILLMRLYWKGLGNFKIPVLIYGLVMPFMVTRAISTLFGNSFSTLSAALVTIGSLMLFLGDVEYGIHRFRPALKPALKFSVGPILYAGGQLLIALSCSYFLP